MNFIIDDMTIKDLEKLENILETEFDDFWNYNILKEEINNENSKYIVAKEDEEIVGFAGIRYNYDCIEIMNIVSKKSHRRKGIGTFLIKKLLKLSEEYNVSKICLEVSENNLSAINLYQKFGFKEVVRRKRYYNNLYDAILMDLDISYI